MKRLTTIAFSFLFPLLSFAGQPTPAELAPLIEKNAAKEERSLELKVISVALAADYDEATKKAAWRFIACRYRTDLKKYDAFIGIAKVTDSGTLDKYDITLYGTTNSEKLCN